MRRTYAESGTMCPQQKTRPAGAGNTKLASDRTPASTQESATVDITPHRTPFVPPYVTPATLRLTQLPYKEGARR